MTLFKRLLNLFFKDLFKEQRSVRLGLYGPPNGGKTTLANKICKDWIGEEMGRTSKIAHETRETQVKEQITIKRGTKALTFSLVDTPGIATKIDYEEFLRAGLPEEEAKTRAKEATKGVIDAIKWLDSMDCVIIVLDAAKDPYTQVNITIVGNLDARKIPLIIAANKVDLKKADVKHVRAAFPQHPVIGISAKTGEVMGQLYEALFDLRKHFRKKRA